MARRLTVNEVMEELDDSEVELEDDSSDDDFDGYLDEMEMLEQEEDSDESEGEQESDDRVSNSLEGDELMQNAPTSIPEYNMEPGCSPALLGNRPIDYFGRMFDDRMLQHVVDQTNLNADQYLTSHELGPHSRIKRWKKSRHDTSELKRFLVLILVMGLVRLPQIENHWCVSWPYSSAACSSVSEIHNSNCMYIA